MQPEYHLFIIWPKARCLEERIIQDIMLRFEIVDLCEMHWSDSYFSENLTRFYGEKLPVGSHKERHCGRGPFLVSVIKDPKPKYANRETSTGNKTVNINLFDAKSLYRKWTGGGHKIHATNDPHETQHDLVLLFGREAEKYYHSDIRNTRLRKVTKDLVGADGWRSISEFFYVLNNTIQYVVLRNFECLPYQYTLEKHGDIDLLVEDYQAARYIANASKVYKSRARVLTRVKINEKNVLVDLRHVGDNYYDERWQRDILLRRVLLNNQIYVPSAEDYFYSLLYHAAVQKPVIADDYRGRLVELAQNADIEGIDKKMFEKPLLVRQLLNSFLKQKNYRFTLPDDFSVYYNQKIAGKINMQINRRGVAELKYFLKPLKHPKKVVKDALNYLRKLTYRYK